MQCEIPQLEVSELCDKIKVLMRRYGVCESVITGTRVIVIHPESWEVSLCVPYKGVKEAEVRPIVDGILFSDCGVLRDYCNYFGKQREYQAFEWYFRHPKIPKDVADRVDAEIRAQSTEGTENQLPIPRDTYSTSDTIFLTLAYKYFDAIKRGDKTVEYRMLSQYYCDKFFTVGTKKRYVRFNRGYMSSSGNQLMFEIEAIVYVDKDYKECLATDHSGNCITDKSKLPEGFSPVMYGIRLGKLIQ